MGVSGKIGKGWCNIDPNELVFTAQRYASAVLVVVMCPSVRRFVGHTPVLYQNG